MDPTFDNLPYQIPGPAGGPSYATPSQALHFPSPLSESARRFRQAAWQSILHSLDAVPYGSTPLCSSIALLRANALSARFTRLPRLPVLLGAFSWVGRDASVTLHDPTGAICATIHAAVFEEHRKGIEPGAVLLLDGVAAISYIEKRPSGFRVDEDEGLHVSVQPVHIKKVIPVATDPPPSPERPTHNPKDAYSMAAVSPPIAPRPRTTSSPPTTARRAPLRQRAEPQNVLNRRHEYGRGQREYRGGYKDRPYQQEPSTPGDRKAPQGSNGAPRKRPYTPYKIPSAPTVRRPGMQPPQKRLAPTHFNMRAPHRPQQQPEIEARNQRPSANLELSATGPNEGLKSLSEDQLDSLFGDFDVDAVIAASGKSQAVIVNSPIQCNSAKKNVSPPPIQAVPIPAKSNSSKTSGMPAETGHGTAKVAANAESPSKEEAEQPSGPPPAAKEATDGQRPLSTMENAMLADLLEGLDAGDFPDDENL